MKLLNGADLAEYIKPRQAQQVRALRQSAHTVPKLVIIQTSDDSVIDKYVSLKKAYGADIFIEVEVHKILQKDALETIKKLNNDDVVHGIIVQLPLANPDQTDEIINAVAPEKDVDALGQNSPYDPATPTAINWLLAGYNIDLRDKKIVIVGEGRLVGAPLRHMWQNSGYSVSVIKEGEDLQTGLHGAEIIVTATGKPSLIKSDLVPIDAILVDAGTATEDGKIVGDISPELYERNDLTLTPRIGGVGPLTVAALFENVIRSARL